MVPGNGEGTSSAGDPGVVQTTLLLLTAIGIFVLLAGVVSMVGGVPADGSADADDDGLPDDRERVIGTDPTDGDTDGDRLPDGWEVAGETPDGAALPGSDPLEKDLYVQVDYGTSITHLSSAEKSQLRTVFADMDVPSPGGKTGIDVHVVDEAPRGGDLGKTVAIDGDRDREAYVETFYSEDSLGARKCVYHLVVVGQVEDGATAGYGDSPGYLSMVDGEDTRTHGGNVTARVRYIVHELLHNLVGKFPDGSYHTSEGWLTHTAVFAGQNEYLSPVTREQLSEAGFASSAYYRGSVCE